MKQARSNDFRTGDNVVGRSVEAGQFCPECNQDTRLETDGDERYCPSCGYVWETDLPNLEDHSRDTNNVGRAPSPGSNIQLGSKVEAFTDYSSVSDAQRIRSKRHEFWARDTALQGQKQTIDHAVREINRICSATGLGDDCRDQARVIYLRARDEGIQYRRALETVASASVYVTIRHQSRPISIDEIAPVLQVETKPVIRAAKVIKRALGLEIEPQTAEHFISKYRSRLGLSMETENRAKRWLEDVRSELSGSSPTNLAGAALYAASYARNDENVCRTDIIEATAATGTSITELWTKIHPEIRNTN